MKDKLDFGTRWIKKRFLHYYNVFIGEPKERSVCVMEKDWDNLIILDACRADLFEETIDLGIFDEYMRVESLGSATPEWVNENFAVGEFKDTIYISANPYVTKYANDSFYKLVEVWKDHFNEEQGTVLPEDVKKISVDAFEDDKRMIIHFMQPHYPFIETQTRSKGWDPAEILEEDERSDTVWNALKNGKLDRDDFWGYYKKNLSVVFPYALTLSKELSGKTVITSDHGNLIGERIWPIPLRMYEHPQGLRHPSLISVPWAVLKDDRRTIKKGEISSIEPDDEKLKIRLQKLGYLEEV
ncbi:MAG: hypothetical protein ABEI13_00370 [Candidatus Paceibacteria bacterium]